MDFRFVGDTNIGAWSVFGNPYSVIGCYRLFLMSPFEFLFFGYRGVEGVMFPSCVITLGIMVVPCRPQFQFLMFLMSRSLLWDPT